MGTILDLEENTPHTVSEVICLRCLHRWICVRPEKTLLKEIECPQCKYDGAVINTGQDLGGDINDY